MRPHESPLRGTRSAHLAGAEAGRDPGCQYLPGPESHRSRQRRGLQPESRPVPGDLGTLDARIAQILASCRGRDFFVFHPAFGYFAAAYGLREVPIQASGKEPGARSLAGLIDRMKAEQVRTVFIQPQFSKRTAEAIAEATGAKLIVLDDLSRNYIGNLEDVAFKIRDSFEGKK